MVSPIQPRKPAPGRSLAELFPDIAAQWDVERNGGALTPKDVSAWSEVRLWWSCPVAEDHRWKAPVAHRAGAPGCPFCRGYRASHTNSLAALFPALAKQLHLTRNETLHPEDIVATSERLHWWKCPAAEDHEWQARSSDRTRSPGCPFCSGKRASATHSLATVNPELAALWHPSRNGALTARDVTPASEKVVWWKCPAGEDHEWRAPIEQQRHGVCPFCRNARASVTNSLAAKHPDIARLWDRAKNGKLTPNLVVPGSTREAWWRCLKGPDHRWRRAVWQVVGNGVCPFCSNWRPSITNCLATVAPDIARHLHPSKNGNLTARNVVATSGRSVWWCCDKDPRHVWKGEVFRRVRNGRWICVICINRRVSPTNSLANRFPKLAAQWDRRKNGKLTPATVTFGFHGRVWWMCPAARDHSWEARVNQRVQRPDCPFCAGRHVSVTNSLAKLFPKVAREWNRARNGDVKPSAVLAAAKDFAWWRCPLGHEWRALIRERTAGGKSCPVCAGAVLPTRTRAVLRAT